MTTPRSGFPWPRWALCGVGALLAVGIPNRELTWSGFDAVPGNLGDSRLYVALLEHWVRVFQGLVPWHSPGFFHPVTGVLGYSDMLLGLALPHALFRMLGLSAVSAYQAVLLLMFLVGYACMVLFLRRGLGLSPWLCVFGGLLFSVLNNRYLSYAHQQHLQFMAVLPLAGWAALAYARNENKAGGAGWLQLGVLLLLTVLMANTSFYLAWFLGFYLLIGCLAATVWLWRREGWGRLGQTARHTLRDLWPQWLLLGLATGLLMAPFLWLYLPVQKHFGGRSVREAMQMLPGPFDFINIGPNNVFWQPLLEDWLAGLAQRPYANELELGFAPLTLLFFLLVWINARKSAGGGERSGPDALWQPALWWMGGIVLICWLLLLKIGPHSLWWQVFLHFPGAAAVRAVNRFQLALSVPVVVVVALGLQRMLTGHSLTGSLGRPLRMGLVVAVGLILLAEQANTRQVANWRKSDYTAIVEKIAPPPAQCQAFYFVRPIRNRHPIHQQLDAMLIAQAIGLPTLHGYSGWSPKNWKLWHPNEDIYTAELAKWRTLHPQSRGWCALDGWTGQWSMEPGVF